MNEPGSGKKIGIILLGVAALVLGVVTALALYGVIPAPQSARLETVHQNLVRKGQLVAAARISLHASAEAEKSAVMADTDEASVAYAEQSKEASAAVEKARKELAELIEKGGERKERDLLNDFSACWERFQEIDRELLPLAVQNTNLKAFDLSFGPASQALKQFETALTHFMDRNASAKEPPVIAGLSFHAFTAALKIQALQAPHIAESRNERMDEMEATMKASDEQVNNALKSLTDLAEKENLAGKSSLQAAKSAYADFQRINSEVIRLSRQNSNVRSLALSLGQKRKVTAHCEDSLAALQEAVRSTTFKATR